MERDMGKLFTGSIKSTGLSIALLGMALTGCQATLFTYKGAKVREAYRIALVDGTQRSDQYRSPDLIIDYQILRNGDELRFSGVAKYTPKIINNYSSIPNFHLDLFLIDPYGNILSEHGVATPGSNDPNNRMRFKEKLKLPPGTTGMAFSYSGEARGSGREDRGAGISFREVPIVQ
jgi:hypothetical protein